MDNSLATRRVALRIVQDVLDKKQPLDRALKALEEAKLAPQDRAFARTLVMLVLRRLGQVDAVIARHLNKPLAGKLWVVQHVLRLGVVQLLWMQVPDHAAIDTSVELLRAISKKLPTGLVNAVLRQVTRDEAELPDEGENLSGWLRKSWEEAYGKPVVDAIAAVQLQEPPLDISVIGDAAKWSEQLEGEVLAGQTIRRTNTAVPALPGYDDGQWWVQDVAASLPAMLLGDVKGQRVLDVCAAPGGKTAQLVATGAQVTALDRSKGRMKRLRENMWRLQMKEAVEVVIADAMQWQPDEPYSHILLDAPCSATGTIRRHPDIVHHRSPENIAELAELQHKLLQHVARWVAPDGVLVYCVCSLQPEEGERQVEAFLQAHPAFELQPIDAAALGWPAEWVNAQGCLRTLPSHLAEQGGMDGFFAAKLVRKG